MNKKLLLSLAVAVLMAAPAFAAVQNVKVSGDIDSWYVNRTNFDLGQRGAAEVRAGLAEQSVFLTQTRLRVDADLSDNVSTTVGLINERAWNAESSSDTNVQLYLAYVTLREFLYSPLTVSVGRQVFHYGNGLIIGDGGQNNITVNNLATVASDLSKRTTYDGVKAVFDYKPLTIDLIYFKNASGVVTGVRDSLKDDSDVYGVNANYQLGDNNNSAVEGYFFARVTGDRNTSVNGGSLATQGDKGDQLYAPGLRVSTNPVKGLNTQAEIAWQLGTKGRVDSGAPAGGDNLHRSAMAYQVMASYALPVAELEKYKTAVNASYTHVSGDKNGTVNRAVGNASSREVYAAWDPFNEAQGGGTIYNTLFDLTNLNIVSVGASAAPIQDVTAAFTWSGLWADRKISSENPLVFRNPDGTITGTYTGSTTGRKDMGNEYDVNVNYAYTEDVTFGVSLGWYIPGKMFSGSNDSTASQALAHVNVNF